MDKMDKSTDRQVGGTHYKNLGPYQPWRIIDALDLNFYEGTILKYLIRKKGNRIEDLEKLIHTAEHYIEVLKRRKEDAGNIKQI